MRHLTGHQAEAALRRGASIEQLLTTTLRDETVSWLSIAATKDGFILRRHEVLDDGDGFLDVHELRPVDADEYAGEGTPVGTFPDVPAVLDAAAGNGARMTHWVNSGVVQDEYAELRSAD